MFDRKELLGLYKSRRKKCRTKIILNMAMSSSLTHAYENCLPLFCSECQKLSGFEKFNDFSVNPQRWFCCCIQIKNGNVNHKCKVNDHNEIDRSECCPVCVGVKIINIPCDDKYLSEFGFKHRCQRYCQKCADYIDIKFMNKMFITMSEAHDSVRNKYSE